MVRNRDLIHNADHIKNLASSSSTISKLEGDGDVARLVVANEFDQLFQYFEKYDFCIIYHRVIRARLEYLLFTLHHFIPQISEQKDLAFVQDLIQHVFRLLRITYTIFHHYSESCANENSPQPLYCEDFIPTNTTDQIDVELQQLTEPYNDCTPWLELCVSSLCSLLIKSLTKTPILRKSLSIHTSDAFALLHSKLPILQVFSLHILAASLQFELDNLAKVQQVSVNKQEKPDRKSSMRRTSSDLPTLEKVQSNNNTIIKPKEPRNNNLGRRTRSAYMSSSSNSKGLEESLFVIQNGGLRGVLGCLLHYQYEGRYAASMVMRTLCFVLHTVSPVDKGTEEGGVGPETISSLPSIPSASLHELWVACIEQGLVPLLELIAAGVPIIDINKTHTNIENNTTPLYFPEKEFRDMASTLLNLMSQHLSLPLSGSIRNKIVQSVSYSGSEQLKRNIMFSVLYLCGRSETLSNLIIQRGFDYKTTLTSSLGDDMKIDLFFIFHKQSHDCDTILVILKHFLTHALSDHNALKLRSSDNKDPSLSIKYPKSASVRRLGDIEMRNWPVVLRVVDSHTYGNNNSIVKSVRMTCPEIEKISKFFPDLAIKIENTQDLQYHYLLQSYDLTTQVTTEAIHKLLSTVPDDCFEVLYGSYDVWQEIFSHVSDGYVRDSSLTKMSKAMLIECLDTAMQYHASPMLIYAYCSYLSMHVQDLSLLETLKVAIVYYDDASKRDKVTQTNAPGDLFYQHSFHLNLAKACVEYALRDGNLKRMIKDSKHFSSKYIAEIWQCFQRLLYIMTS